MTALSGKRVVFVFTRLELGGAERQGLLVARHLKEQYGADVRMVGMQGESGGLASACAAGGIPCRALDLGAMDTPVGCALALFRFFLLLRREHPDLVISYTRNANLYSACTWRLCGAAGFVWNQADEGLNLGRDPFSRLAAALTPCFVSNSSGGLHFLRDCYGIAGERLHLIHNGIALPRPEQSRSQWRERLGLGTGEFVAGMVANISRYKDHDTLLRAWQRVVDHSVVRPVLLLAGRFDRSEGELLRLRDELGLGDRVRFLGPVDDVAGLLGALDLFVYSSRSEGLPNGVVEAMAAGLAVAGTDIPGIREALGTGGEAFLSAPGDPAGLAGNILRLISDPALRNRLGEQLQQCARSRFSLETMLKASADLFAAIIEGGEGNLRLGNNDG